MGALKSYSGNNFYIHHSIDKSPLTIKNKFAAHMHDKVELYYFISGEAKMYIEGNAVELKKGTVLLMKAGTTHALSISGNTVYERIALLFSNDFSSLDDYNILYDKTGFVLEMLNTILHAEDKEKCVNAFIPALLYKISSEESGLVSSDKIIQYVYDHLTEEINLDTIAAHFYISKEYLCRKFKSQVGIGIWKFIINKRLLLARQNILLYKNVKKGFESSGFKDYSAFYRQYLAFFGKSPRADLEQAKEI